MKRDGYAGRDRLFAAGSRSVGRDDLTGQTGVSACLGRRDSPASLAKQRTQVDGATSAEQRREKPGEVRQEMVARTPRDSRCDGDEASSGSSDPGKGPARAASFRGREKIQDVGG